MNTTAIHLVSGSVAVLLALPVLAAEPQKPSQVKVAAVQMLGYDKTDVPRPSFDPSEAVVRYIEKAAKDQAQLVVFPEYLLSRIPVPGPQTERISQAAASGHIYVIVGCWEVCEDGSFANTALLFDRAGKIAGKYHKVHAAAEINLAQVRQARKHSRNVQQRRPELYREIANPVPPASGHASEGRSPP